MRAAGVEVHTRCGDGAMRVAEEEQVQRVLLSRNAMHREVLEMQKAMRVLGNAHFFEIFAAFLAVIRSKQIIALLLVNLEE